MSRQSRCFWYTDPSFAPYWQTNNGIGICCGLHNGFGHICVWFYIQVCANYITPFSRAAKKYLFQTALICSLWRGLAMCLNEQQLNLWRFSITFTCVKWLRCKRSCIFVHDYFWFLNINSCICNRLLYCGMYYVIQMNLFIIHCWNDKYKWIYL